MKKINVLIIFALAVIVGFSTSCKKDTIDPASILAPIITFVEGDQTVNELTAVTVSGNVVAEGELSKVTIKKKIISSGAVTTLEDITKFTEDTYVFSKVFVANEVTESFSIEVEATDKNDKVVSKSVTVTVTNHDTGIDKTTSAIRLYTAPGDQSNVEDRFASLTPTFDTYTWSSAQGNEATIDLMYYNGNYTKLANSVPHFVSANVTATNPHNGEALSGNNTTYFLVLTGTDAATIIAGWDAIDDDTSIAAIPNATITATNVTWDDTGAPESIIVFLLSDGKKGFIKPGNAVDGNANTQLYDATFDYIDFDVIVQKEASLIAK